MQRYEKVEKNSEKQKCAVIYRKWKSHNATIRLFNVRLFWMEINANGGLCVCVGVWYGCECAWIEATTIKGIIIKSKTNWQ